MGREVDLTQEYVQSILSYDKNTGEFVWKQRPDRNKSWNTKQALNKTGTKTKDAVLLRIDDTLYKAHRIAWLYEYGFMPDKDIDHKDCNPHNNAIINLRVVTKSQNQCNRRVQSNNTSGYKGVSFSKLHGKWHAYIKINGKRRHIGLYNCPTAAHIAYKNKALEIHGEYARFS